MMERATRHDPLAVIVAELDRFEIPHMLAGSFASTFHGEPRTTHDIDLVVDPSREALMRFVSGLDRTRFYVSPEAALEAWNARGRFNVVLLESGWKVDLILRKDRPSSRAEFARRRAVSLAGADVFIATAEDTIIAKLEWPRAGESERQLRDVVGILAASGPDLDLDYLEPWIGALGLESLWARTRSAAD